MIKNTTTRIWGRCYKIEYWVFQTCSPGIDTLKCNWISPDSASWSLYHWGPPFYGSNNEKRTNYRTVIHVNLMLWTSLVISGSNFRAPRLPSEVHKMRKSTLGQGLERSGTPHPTPEAIDTDKGSLRVAFNNLLQLSAVLTRKRG